MSDKKIRVAIKEDLPLLLSWGKRMYEVEKQYMPLMKYSEEEARDRYTNQILDPNFLFLVAELDNEPVGYLYAHVDMVDYLDTDKPQCEIEVVFLDDTARGFGLSQDLINSAIEWAEKKDVFGVKAGIFAQNMASRKAFERAGFFADHITYTTDV